MAAKVYRIMTWIYYKSAQFHKAQEAVEVTDIVFPSHPIKIIVAITHRF